MNKEDALKVSSLLDYIETLIRLADQEENDGAAKAVHKLSISNAKREIENILFT